MRKIFGIIFILSLALGLCGCSEAGAEAEDLDENEYYVYYINSSITKLEPEIYASEARGDDLAADLIDRLTGTPDDINLVVPLPDDVYITRTESGEGGQFFVYFNAMYNEMDLVREVLCRAAVVKTLTQVDGIDYVGFYVNEQPLMDASNNVINLMTGSSFVEDAGSETSKLQRAEITLYFADETGTYLVGTQEDVVCSVGTATEYLVVSELLKGPESEDLYPTITESAQILQVSVKDRVCYVNFDSAFLENELEVGDYIPIYSIVNSLTELPTVSRVQFSVEGANNISFRDSIPLDQPLERNMEYVCSEESEE